MPANFEIPPILSSKSWIIEKHTSALVHPLREIVKKLLLVSDYACRHIELIQALLAEDPCNALLTRADYFYAIKQLNWDSSQQHFLQKLRFFRHTHFIRLLLLELACLASTEEVMQSWSDCADAIILHTLEYLKHSLRSRYGIARDEDKNEVSIIALAMGKLGGSELNYSSDIDLIFAFSQAGMTDGSESISNQQYFSKMIQQFVQTLQNITPDGLVFRVDLRLRPNGDSGPLVSNWTALETYYQEQGRDWERYAMVKARVIVEQIDKVPLWFNELITPFVYRRYVDFSVIVSLRSMKAMIEREVQVNPSLNDIKRGQGGIREIEFIIQNVQLIRGGRVPSIRQTNAMAALNALKQAQLIPRSEVLKQAYLFLRKLENMLQSLNDQQTHSLPQDPIKQEQIMLAMGYSSWNELAAKLQQYQRIVSHSFQSALGKVEAFEDERRVLANQLGSVWQGHVEDSMAVNLLTSLGFENAEHCYQMLYTFKHSARCSRLTQAARMRLDRFMLLLLTELTNHSQTDKILIQVIHLLEQIVGRSAYLALLSENPPVLNELLLWFTASPFISNLLVHYPFLLEILLDPVQEWQPLTRTNLAKSLQELLAHSNFADAQEEVLRQFKLINWLRAARAELFGLQTAVRIGKFLSDLAEVIVNQTILIAHLQLALRYPDIMQLKQRFAVIAYGTFGSREMNYTSDLDLVFLHTAIADEELLVTRLTQKIVHMLTTRSQMGVLYSVDTRLRPSGAAGLLVSHVDAFIEYQKNHAWIWEHQALLKARNIWGNSKIKHAFRDLKKSIFALARDKVHLQQEILNMRAKIEHYQLEDPIKHTSGGLLDLEFLVQFLVLNARNECLAGNTHTLAQLKLLFNLGYFNKEQYKIFTKAYKYYHHLLHQKIIQDNGQVADGLQKEVLFVCKEIYAVK